MNSSRLSAQGSCSHVDLTAPSSSSKEKQEKCPVCEHELGRGAVVLTKENVVVHAMCFVCSRCKCELRSGEYGCDMNGKFYCSLHMTSARPSEKEYKTLAKGWLRKQGNIVKKWRRRYFVLEVDSCEIRYYKSEDPEDNCGVIDLAVVSGIQPAYLYVPADKNHPELPSGSLPALQLLTPGRVWNLACDTDSDREYWLDAIRTAQATYSPASPAASHGVGRNVHDSCSSPNMPSPKASLPSSRTVFMSPSPTRSMFPQPPSPPKQIGQPEIQRPASAVPEKSIVPIINSGTSTPDSDGVETSSPDDSSCTATATTSTLINAAQEVRARRESGLGRGDGSAPASQSIASTTTSCGPAKRRMDIQPIIVPSSLDSGSNTSTPVTGVQFLSPVAVNKKISGTAFCSGGLGSPVAWMPSTPRGADTSQNSIWEYANSTGSGSSQGASFLSDSRLRAASAGATLRVQHEQVNAPAQASEAKSVLRPRLVIARARGITQEPIESTETKNRYVSQEPIESTEEKDSLLCSLDDKPLPSTIDCRQMAQLQSDSVCPFTHENPLSSAVPCVYAY